MAYATCTKHRRQIPAFTSDLATQRAAYAAERSTFVKSLPEKAPPPCAPQPPYVSTMILRPVSPASPCGPPMMNSPHGLMCTTVFASKYLAGITSLITLSMISLRSSSSRHHDRVHTLRNARTGLEDVFGGDLSLGVGPCPPEIATAAQFRNLFVQPMGQHHGQRHALFGFIGSVSEHETLE
uniref:Uncharacterized protein n=1 Tax=Anopheles maculatus TaxID=74869 RepID=A0A182T6V2_9DIPT